MLRVTALVSVVFLVVVVVTSPVAASDLDALVSLTSGITPKDPSWSITTPACQWKNVVCDATGRVTEILWQNMGLSGFANLTVLPAGLTVLVLSQTGNQNGNQLTGTPDLADLPQGLQEMHLSNNNFSGGGSFSVLLGNWCYTPVLMMCGAYDGVFQCSSGMRNCAAAPTPAPTPT